MGPGLVMIDCHKCRYYYVTWDVQFPHGCRAMNFKSKHFPSSEVYRSSGMDCLKYEQREKKPIPSKDPNI